MIGTLPKPQFKTHPYVPKHPTTANPNQNDGKNTLKARVYKGRAAICPKKHIISAYHGYARRPKIHMSIASSAQC